VWHSAQLQASPPSPSQCQTGLPAAVAREEIVSAKVYQKAHITNFDQQMKTYYC
jgi:hypothetical protein